MCEECKQMFLVRITKAISCFANVLLTNYSIDITIAKVSGKLSKFEYYMKVYCLLSTPIVTTGLVY